MVRLSAALIVCSVFAVSCSYAPDPLPGFPRLILWAWERPEDLRFIDAQEVGVAFLAQTIFFKNERVISHPRLQPLLVPPATKLIAVVRIESRGDPPASPHDTIELIRAAALMQGVSALQLDFDATLRERVFYRKLLYELRAALPPGMPLAITALVSWCASDHWIDNLPVNDAIPMYFRMGGERFSRSERVRSPLCFASTGLATDELIRVPLHRRVFLFHPRPWTRYALQNALAQINRWS